MSTGTQSRGPLYHLKTNSIQLSCWMQQSKRDQRVFLSLKMWSLDLFTWPTKAYQYLSEQSSVCYSQIKPFFISVCNGRNLLGIGDKIVLCDHRNRPMSTYPACIYRQENIFMPFSGDRKTQARHRTGNVQRDRRENDEHPLNKKSKLPALCIIMMV